MTAQKIINSELQSIMDDLEKEYIRLGMKASGQWAESLESITEETNGHLIGKIYGEDYTEQLINGRRPGSFPPIKAIEKWIYDKGLILDEGTTFSQLAFLIARKIARSGTKYYQEGGTDLIESVVTKDRVNSIIDKIKDYYITGTREVLTKALTA